MAQTLIVIDDVVTTYTDRPHSHRAAWARMLRCVVEDLPWVEGEVVLAGPKNPEIVLKADTWLVAHGMEFRDGYNLPSGVTPELAARVRRLLEFEGKLVSLERPMPDVGALLSKRSDVYEQLTGVELAAISKRCAEADVVYLPQLVSGAAWTLLGDSHTLARYGRDGLVIRNDGLTLRGLTREGVIAGHLDAAGVQHTRKLSLVGGNIDIRHHFCRPGADTPEQVVEALVKELTKIRDRFDMVEVTAPYPIEHEGRRLPKTGWFKGTPFYGSWAERDEMRRRLEAELGRQFTHVFRWPAEWYDLDPEEYAARHMEKPQSVHLSPASYPWDLDRNELRWAS